MKLALFLLFGVSCFAQSVCLLAGITDSTGHIIGFKCTPASSLGIVGPPGPIGPPGTAGTQQIMIGGPCANADGSPGLFVQLPTPSSGCLPVTINGTVKIIAAVPVDGTGQPLNAKVLTPQGLIFPNISFVTISVPSQ